ncbi:MAG TPA: NAD(P)-dependent oxidoreductase [Pseudonocardia sp.]
MTTTTTKAVALLGTGIMGAGMARNIARSGLATTVWNRDAKKARPLADDGATVADDPASAVAGADVIVTMLFDAASVESVMEQALPSAAKGAIWVQSSTVGLDGALRLAELADRAGVDYIDAPVLGTRQPAEEGKLLVLAGGPEHLRAAVTPVLDAVGTRTVWVGPRPGDGHRLKLVANSWVLTVMGGTAQAVALAEGLGLDPQQFLDTIAGGGLDCGYAQLKGRAMMSGDFSTSFTTAGAAKDASLIADALRGVGAEDNLMRALHAQFAAAADAGHAEDDMASVVEAVRHPRPS